MGQQLISTTVKELETFLFQKAHLQFRVGEQILAMRDCTMERSQKRRIATRFWPITVFAVDEAEQVLDGRSVDLFVYADSMPGVPDMLELLLTYPEAIREVWDARHSRCYGFTTWDKEYGSKYEYVEQAQAQYEEYKAITLKMRMLLGSRLFSVLRAMDL